MEYLEAYTLVLSTGNQVRSLVRGRVQRVFHCVEGDLNGINIYSITLQMTGCRLEETWLWDKR